MKRTKLGPTRDFPRGKLNSEDEGGLMMKISEENSAVRLDFGKPIAWIALPPDEALTFAATIVKHAMAIKGGRRHD